MSHPPLSHRRAPPGRALPAAQAAAVWVPGWLSCPVLLSTPACTLPTSAPPPREPPLTHDSSVQQGPLSRPEVRAPRACGMALQPACDLGQVLEAQPLAWDMGAQEKAPVLSSERPGARPGQACGRGHPRLLAQTGPGYGGCGVQPLRPPRPSRCQIPAQATLV